MSNADVLKGLSEKQKKARKARAKKILKIINSTKKNWVKVTSLVC